MKIKIPSIIFFFLLNFNSVLYAEASDDAGRMDVINRELDCFSDAASRGKVDWNDICVTSPAIEEILSDAPSRDEIIDKSMEQVIKEHNLTAREMLEEPFDEDDTRDRPTTVDEVYEEHNRDQRSEKNMDDVIRDQDQDIERDFQNEETGGSFTPKARSFDEEPSYLHRSVDSSLGEFARDPDKSYNTSELGFEFNRYRYDEPVFDLLTRGNLFGLYANYTARPAKGEALYEDILNMYRAEVRFNYGLVNYKSAPSGKLDEIQDWAVEARLLVGKDFMMTPDVRATPYIGFGYRYLNDDSAGRATSTGAIGYERESRYYYIPMGVEFTTKISDSWMVSPTLEYDYFIQGEQLSYLSDVHWAYPDLRNKQREGLGLRGSLKFVQTGASINFVFEPYIRYWHIEDSEEATVAGPIFLVTGLEPENKTLEYGIRMGAMF